MEKIEFILMLHDNNTGDNSFNYDNVHWNRVKDLPRGENKDTQEDELMDRYGRVHFDSKTDLFKVEFVEHYAKNVKNNSYNPTLKILSSDQLNWVQVQEHKDFENMVSRFTSTRKTHISVLASGYKENYVEDKEFHVELNCVYGSDYVNIKFDKIRGSIQIDTKNDYFSDYIKQLAVKDYTEQRELEEDSERYSKLQDLIETKEVKLLSNGFVINNKYYEDLDDYLDEVKEIKE